MNVTQAAVYKERWREKITTKKRKKKKKKIIIIIKTTRGQY